MIATRPAHTPTQSTARGAIIGTLLIGICWLALFGFQLVRSMQIDAYELSQTRFDLLGYWIGFAIAFMMGLRMLHHDRMLLTPFILIFLLIFYMTAVRMLTAPMESPIAFLISRYGLVMWFVLGIGFAEILHILQRSQRTPAAKRVRQVLLIVCGILALPTVSFAQEIILSPVSTKSYQAVANTATVLLVTYSCLLIVVWGRSLPLWIAAAYTVITTLVVAAVALLQSTSIVALWLGLMVVFFGQRFHDSRPVGKLAILLIALLGINLLIQSEAFEKISEITRFAVFFEGGENFSPIASRQSILSTFFDQFSVSPLFGHFQAEVVSGAGEGNFVHSLPLSFLTHSGVIGTVLATVILVIILRQRNTRRRQLDPSEPRLALLMWVILGIGTISTFLSWPVFWFMLGVLCRKPTKPT
jgi:hypothetical protein